MNLLAAKQSHMERSKNKSSGFNAGVEVMIGDGISVGITAGGNYGKGYGNGDETTYAYTHVGDANSQTNIESGAITTLKGAQVQGKGVKLSASDLNIESLQETLTYKGKQMNVSGQVTVGYGFSASGSYSQSKMNADYASVIEQSGIYAGDDGYQIDIQNHTDLKGGLITSSQTAEDNGKNNFETGTLSYADIRNHADYKGSGFGLNGGVTVSGGNAPKDIGDVKLKNIGSNNQDGSSKIEYSGIAGIGTQGNWGITKGLTTSLLGQVKQESNESGLTVSSINTRYITITDETRQQKLIGKTTKQTIEELNRENIHQTVNKVDIQQARSDLERDLDTVTEFVKNINNQGDEIYYQMEKNEDSIFSIQKTMPDCNHVTCLAYDVDNSQELKRIIYGNEILTDEQAKLLSKVATAGMLNLDRESKVSSAILYDKDLASIDDTAVILNRGSAGHLNEFLFTAFERFRAWANVPMIFGASNATRDHAQINKKLDEYNAHRFARGEMPVTVDNIAHSLGVSGNKNMLNWSEYVGNKYDNTKINFLHLGGSYPSSEIDKQAKGLFKDVNTEYHGVDGDFVYQGAPIFRNIGWGMIGNNPNAKAVNGLTFGQAHSDANYNINNLKFIDDGSINEENYNLLKRIYPNTNGNRELNHLKGDK